MPAYLPSRNGSLHLVDRRGPYDTLADDYAIGSLVLSLPQPALPPTSFRATFRLRMGRGGGADGARFFCCVRGKRTGMPRRARTPAFRGSGVSAETRLRLEEMEGRLSGLQDELMSLFQLLLEDRDRIAALEAGHQRTPPARRRSRGGRSSRRKKSRR